MRKIFNCINRLNWIQLGALNGLIFGLLIELFVVSVMLYLDYLEYLDSITPHEPSGVSICVVKLNLNWIIFPILPITIISGLVAGFFMQRILTKNTKYKILQWQIFGIAFFVMFLIGERICAYYKDLQAVSPLHRPKDFYPFFNSLISIRLNSEELVCFSIILIFNLLFALLLIKREGITK